MNTTILLIVCVILLIVGISLTIYFVTKGKSEKPAPSDKKSESKPGAPGVPVTTPWLTQAHNNIVGNKRFLIQNSASGKYITLNDVRDYKNISFTTSDISKATVFDYNSKSKSFTPEFNTPTNLGAGIKHTANLFTSSSGKYLLFFVIIDQNGSPAYRALNTNTYTDEVIPGFKGDPNTYIAVFEDLLKNKSKEYEVKLISK